MFTLYFSMCCCLCFLYAFKSVFPYQSPPNFYLLRGIFMKAIFFITFSQTFIEYNELICKMAVIIITFIRNLEKIWFFFSVQFILTCNFSCVFFLYPYYASFVNRFSKYYSDVLIKNASFVRREIFFKHYPYLRM